MTPGELARTALAGAHPGEWAANLALWLAPDPPVSRAAVAQWLRAVADDLDAIPAPDARNCGLAATRAAAAELGRPK